MIEKKSEIQVCILMFHNCYFEKNQFNIIKDYTEKGQGYKTGVFYRQPT